jgi:opacity protein-like surface antigen
MRARKSVFVVALAFVAMGVASAGDHDMKGWYVGVGAGSASTELETPEGSETVVDDNTTAVRVFGGYRAGKFFAVELGVGDFGEVTATLPDGDTYKATLAGWDINLFGILPLADELLDLYIKVGITESEINETIVGGGDPVRQFDTNSTDYQVGAGLQLNFLKDRSLGLRLDYTVRDTKTRVESWDTASLSLLYRF